MCGIAGVHIKPSARGKIAVGHLMDHLLLGIEHRGKDATGFLSVSFSNEVQVDKQAIPAKQFIKTRKSIKGHPQTVIAHTRLATQGHQSQNENNHPVQYGTMFVTHNGVIFNDHDLFRQYDWERNAEVDTVAIPAMLWDMCEGGDFSNAGKALEKIDGMMAIAAVDVRAPGKLLLARGYSSPLVMFENKDLIIWASTVGAIQHAWGKVLGTPPKEKKFTVAKEGELFLIENGVMTKETFDYQVHEYVGAYTGWGRDHSWQNDEDRDDWTWSRKDDFTYPSKGRGGYWVTDGSTRKYVEMSDPPKSTSHVITAKDMELVNSYTEWAEADVQINKEAFAAVGEEMDMSPALVEWLIVYAPKEIIDGDVAIAIVHNAAKEAYDEAYERLCGEYSAPAKIETKPPFEPQRVYNTTGPDLWECIDCGYETTNVYRCNLCIEENKDNPMLDDYRSAMDRDPKNLMQRALEAVTGGE